MLYVINHVYNVGCILCLQDGRSALHMASKGGHAKIVSVLLRRQANPNQYADDVSDIIQVHACTCTLCKGSA